MQLKSSHKWNVPLNSFRFLIVTTLVIAIFFRFINLDQKVYSYDEAITSLRISGYTWTEMVEQDFQGEIISVKDLQSKYQHINSEKGAIDTINGLASEEAQLPPLYFLAARFWVQLFGPSVAVVRSISALSSLLVFPCVYWLCLELFESSLVGWVAILLMAVSPYHVLYAQEARPYMFWAVMTLLSSTALLRAMRVNTKLSWGVYAATVPLGLYTHLLFALVSLSHGIYVIVIAGFRISKKVISYVLASVIGLLAFSPWIFAVLANFEEIDDTTSAAQLSLFPLSAARNFFQQINRIFIDTHWAGGLIDFGFQNLVTDLIRLIIVGLLFLMLGYGIYFIVRKESLRVWFFPLALAGVTGTALIAVGKAEARYLVPCYLGIQIIIAYLFATQMTTMTVPHQQQKGWRVAFMALLVCGVLSCTVSSQAQLWWNKYPSSTKHNPSVAKIINQSPHPLIISHGENNLTGTILSLSYLLQPDVQLQLISEPELVTVPEQFSDVFLYRPTEALESELEQELDYKIEPVEKPWLWRVQP